MGFRSTLISQEYSCADIPTWFIEKYEYVKQIKNTSIFYTTSEFKMYGGEKLFEDIHKALVEVNFFDQFHKGFELVFVVLAEDGFITKVVVTREGYIFIRMAADEHYQYDCLPINY